LSEPGGGRHALAGAVAAAVALGTTELVAGALGGMPSLLQSVAGVVIDYAPIALVRAAIAALGTRDKPALIAGVVVLSLLLGAGLALAARHRRWVAVVGLAAFAAFGAWAGVRMLGGELWRPALTALVGMAAGVATLAALVWHAPRPAPAETPAPAPAETPAPALADTPATMPALAPSTAAGLAEVAGAARTTRRSFLVAAGSLLVVATGAGTGGRLLQARARASARQGVVLPGLAQPAPKATTSLDVPGLSTFITPNNDFYRIDVATSPPLVDLRRWRLKLTGMVDRPFELSYEELLAMPLEEHDVTLVCVSNEVGDRLSGNARWRGVRLDELLRRAGARPGATQVVGSSVDGFTTGFPTRLALDGRDAMVAVGMNGEPLPEEHGFPARLIVPGLYGYVSACKWLEEIRLTPFERFDAYWIERGWAKEGPMKTMARVDTPTRNRTLRAGRVPVAGVAWASHVGISKVEVQIDAGPWIPARLGPGERDTWRQWVVDWDAPPGPHTIRARATDGHGLLQTARTAPSYPSGATGWHTVHVTVAARS
jgi:DMSO/TMAO reductase YedYZ molybdopterin-dependent catalytic subunit